MFFFFFLVKEQNVMLDTGKGKKKKKTLVDLSFLRPLDVIFAMCHSST